MSFICDYCGKGRQRGRRVSHAKNRSIRFFKPNLHKHLGRLLCARCIKKSRQPGEIKTKGVRK